MDAPQSKRFEELLRNNPDAGHKAIKSSIEGRRRTWLDRVFEIGGKRYKVVSLGESHPTVNNTSESDRSNNPKEIA